MYFTPICYISIVVQNICGKNLIEVKLPIVNCKSWDSSPCKMSVYILHFTLAAWNGHLYVSQKRHRNARSLHNVALHTTTENLPSLLLTETEQRFPSRNLLPSADMNRNDWTWLCDLYGKDDCVIERGRFYSNWPMNTTCNISVL